MPKIVKIPEEIRNSFVKREVCRGQVICYGKNGMIGYIISGEVQSVRYQEGKKFIFPKFLEKGEFLGLVNLLLDNDTDFELETKDDSIILEIPIEVFKKYMLAESAMEIEFLKKINLYLLETTKAFFIRGHGGTKVYMAYLLYILSEKKNVIELKRNSEIEDIVFSSRTMVYKTIKEFENKNILRKESKKLIIEERDLLKKYFEKYIS